MRIITSEENMKSRLFSSNVVIATFVLILIAVRTARHRRGTVPARRETGGNRAEGIRHSPASRGRRDQGSRRL